MNRTRFGYRFHVVLEIDSGCNLFAVLNNQSWYALADYSAIMVERGSGKLH